MSITFSCHHCGKALTTSEDKAGRKAKCPGCGEVLTVPEPGSPDDLEAIDALKDAGRNPEGDDLDFPQSTSRREPSSRQASSKTCPMCGAENARRAKKCEACGETFSEESRESRRYERSHQIIEAGDVISTTWRIFQRDLWVLVGAAAVCIGIGFAVYGAFFVVVLAIIASTENGGNRGQGELIINLISLPFGLIAAVGVAYLNSGLNKLLLAVARGEESSVGILFSGGRFTVRAFLIGLLYQIMITMGSYCCVIPGIILSLMFWPYLYVIVDEDAPGIESLTKAKDITTKNWLSAFVLGLVAFAVGLVGAITCIGMPFAMAFGWLTFAVAYCKMTGQPTAE